MSGGGSLSGPDSRVEDHLPPRPVAHRHLRPLLLPPLRPFQARHLELVPVGGEEQVGVRAALPGARPAGQGAAAASPRRATPASPRVCIFLAGLLYYTFAICKVIEQLLRSSDDFVWQVDVMAHGRFTIDVEFLDLRIATNNATESSPSIWPNEVMVQNVASKSTLGCLSRMLTESIHADVTINTTDGVLKAHKSILAACSPVFESMLLHDLKEKESSTIDINDMCVESCSALLGFVYGTIKQDQFWKHRLSLLAAANKYGICEIKDCCEERVLEDISSRNVLERLHAAWLYQLERLKKGCLTYLFVFGKIYDVRDETNGFFHHADRELMLEMFHEVLSVWKPI